MSHSPMVTADDSLWGTYSSMDRRSPLLIDKQGHPLTYQELEAQQGNQYAQEATPEHWKEQWQAIRQGVAHLAADVEQANLDALIVIGDDQMELFSYANIPALSIYYGEKLVSGVFPDYPGMDKDVLRAFAVGYAMEARHEFASNPAFALELIERLIDMGFDVGAHREMPTTGPAQGIGHAYGIMVTQLMTKRQIPMVPVLVNTYHAPNQPTPSRSYDLGTAIRAAVEASPLDFRVGIIASGGLSHFVTDEDLDMRVLKALREGNELELRNLPRHLLNSGNSEIRNWITVAAASTHLTYRWDEYIPVYRTAAGTGCGIAFSVWS